MERRGTWVTTIPAITSKATSPHNHGDGRLHHRCLSSDATTTVGGLGVDWESDTSEIMPVKSDGVTRLADRIGGSA